MAVLCTRVAWLRSDTTLADRAPMHYNVSDLVLEYSNDLQFSYRWGHETNNMDSKLSRSVCLGPESCDEHLYMASVIVVVIVCCWCFCSCCCFWTSKSPCTYPSPLEYHTFSDYHHMLAKRRLLRGDGWHFRGHWEPEQVDWQGDWGIGRPGGHGSLSVFLRVKRKLYLNTIHKLSIKKAVYYVHYCFFITRTHRVAILFSSTTKRYTYILDIPVVVVVVAL